MNKNKYHWLWWAMAACLVAGIIGYVVVRQQEQQYPEGTFVWKEGTVNVGNDLSECAA
mgnify:CR=1 FL=1